MNKKSVDYGEGFIWYFDNYPTKYPVYWWQFRRAGILDELPSQTLWL